MELQTKVMGCDKQSESLKFRITYVCDTINGRFTELEMDLKKLTDVSSREYNWGDKIREANANL